MQAPKNLQWESGPQAETGISDAVAVLKQLREKNGGLLDAETIRTMNMNGFEVVPDYRTMQLVGDEYRRTHEIFK